MPCWPEYKIDGYCHVDQNIRWVDTVGSPDQAAASGSGRTVADILVLYISETSCHQVSQWETQIRIQIQIHTKKLGMRKTYTFLKRLVIRFQKYKHKRGFTERQTNILENWVLISETSAPLFRDLTCVRGPWWNSDIGSLRCLQKSE